MSLNYVRVLRKVKCSKCDYHGYDHEFEDYTIDENEPFQYTSIIKIICPKCKEKDTMVILDEFKPPTINYNIKY